jgi:adenylyl-sulfate kinase
MTENIQWHEGKVNYTDRCRLLGQKGVVVWFTGLSGSGKSTIAVALEAALIQQGRAVYRLDGDNIRCGLNQDLGFSAEDRAENIRRISEVANLFRDAGIITLACFISPLKAMRQQAKQIIGPDHFIEIFVKADLATCQRRDPKGLYQKAANGEIANFTGISAPYEEPEAPDCVIDTVRDNLDTCVHRVTEVIKDK